MNLIYGFISLTEKGENKYFDTKKQAKKFKKCPM